MKSLETYDHLITIDVDVQNDFASNHLYPNGKLAVPDGEAVVPVLNGINQWTRDRKGNVIFTGDWHKKGSKHFKAQGGPWPEHCIQYTAGAAFHDDLEILPGDTVAYKGMGMEDDGYSGWFAQLSDQSPLYMPGYGRYDPEVRWVEQAVSMAANLYNAEKKRVAVLVGGLATDYCVRATALDALKRSDEAKERYGAHIGVFVIKDAVRAVDVTPGDGEKALAEMEAAGAMLITSEELLAGKVLQIATVEKG